MRNFVLGIVVTILALLIGSLGLALLGFLPTRANTMPPQMESHIAMSAMDSSVERHAPRLNNPVPPTDENLIEGVKIYTMNCALCHGGIDRQASPLSTSFYPPPPSLLTDPPDDPEWHVYYVIRNGVRYTGMPAWDKALSDADIWKVTALLTRLNKLPPAVQTYWKNASGVDAPSATPAEHEHK
ncbi:MAG TPA: cytochrome c [Terriglobales bacterium]|jgi:thiosulfate dehydrogenase|nr:cytochrome c [Terriglobales bacterium]